MPYFPREASKGSRCLGHFKTFSVFGLLPVAVHRLEMSPIIGQKALVLISEVPRSPGSVPSAVTSPSS